MRIFNVFSFLSITLLIACTEKVEQSPNQESTNLKIQGSNTELEMVNTMAHEFMESSGYEKTFEIEGGGSNKGIEALKKGEVRMINSSRKLTMQEYQYFHDQNIDIQEVIFALDAIAIITHPSTGIDSLSIQQLSQIFSGAIKNWKALGGKNAPIHLYGRNSSSGTYAYMQDRLFGNQTDFDRNLKKLEDHNAILSAVENDSLAIGYVDLSTVKNENGLPYPNVWIPSLYIEGQEAYSPFELDAIENENYPLTRPLFQFIKLPMTDQEKAFVQYELSEEGQDLVRNFGFYPILSIHRHINKEAGL